MNIVQVPPGKISMFLVRNRMCPDEGPGQGSGHYRGIGIGMGGVQQGRREMYGTSRGREHRRPVLTEVESNLELFDTIRS